MGNDDALIARVAVAETNIDNLQKTLIAYNQDFSRRIQEAEDRIILKLDHRISLHEDRIAALTSKVEKIVEKIETISFNDMKDENRSQQTLAAVIIIVALVQAFIKFS